MSALNEIIPRCGISRIAPLPCVLRWPCRPGRSTGVWRTPKKLRLRCGLLLFSSGQARWGSRRPAASSQSRSSTANSINREGSIWPSRSRWRSQPGTEYVLQDAGITKGIFDINSAQDVDGYWFGYGAWKPMTTPPKRAKPKQGRLTPRSWVVMRGTAIPIWSEKMAAEARTVLPLVARPHLPRAPRLPAIHLPVIPIVLLCASGRTRPIHHQHHQHPAPAVGIARLRRRPLWALTRTGRTWPMASRA